MDEKIFGYSELIDKKKYARFFSYSFLKKLHIFPIYVTDSKMSFACTDPSDQVLLDALKKEFTGYEIFLKKSTLNDIENALNFSFKQIHSIQATNELRYRLPENSAYTVVNKSQRFFLIALVITFSLWFFYDYPTSLTFLFSIINICYFIFNPIKFLSLLPLRKDHGLIKISDEELEALDESTLPIYTILVPVYKEANVLPIIVNRLKQMDYPTEKKDIKIILEEDDSETYEAAKKLGLVKVLGETIKNPEFEVLIVPKADIKTKPRACNFAFLGAVGDLVVIYDAEDRPDANQLKKAVIAFKKCPEKTICLQGLLGFFNDRENILTQWFTLEYSAWFQFYLPGLERIGAPIPLGGTSNHFRANFLREIGSWDPYNVTEDADLGLRIYQTDYSTAIFESNTFEEANKKLWNWIRQRSRWEKGYIQTYLVQMRQPKELLKQLGIYRFTLLHLTFGANTLLPLINPILWFLTLTSLIMPGILPILAPSFIGAVSLINLLLGNLFFISVHLIVVMKKKSWHLILAALTIPFYWGLISIGAWKGLIQLFTNPFYWEKTVHGITTMGDE